MKTHLSTRFLVLGALLPLLLCSCEYPHFHGSRYRTGPSQPFGLGFGTARGALLGGAIRASQDQTFFVRGGPVYTSRFVRGPYRAAPIYSSFPYRRPGYCYQPGYAPYHRSYNYHPWGGVMGRGTPYNWGNGLGWNTSWY